jgi:hypothetical protein
MTEQQAWIEIGRQFETYAAGGKYAYVAGSGLCAAVNRLPGLTQNQRDNMRSRLRFMRSCESFWYAVNQERAQLRANAAYLLAAGMAE